VRPSGLHRSLKRDLGKEWAWTWVTRPNGTRDRQPILGGKNVAWEVYRVLRRAIRRGRYQLEDLAEIERRNDFWSRIEAAGLEAMKEALSNSVHPIQGETEEEYDQRLGELSVSFRPRTASRSPQAPTRGRAFKEAVAEVRRASPKADLPPEPRAKDSSRAWQAYARALKERLDAA